MIDDFIPPMLCKKSIPDLTGFPLSKYIFQKKYDGIRAIFIIKGENLEIHNRRFANISNRLPEFFMHSPTIFLKDSTEVILDGELVYFDKGKPNIYITQFRDKDHADDIRRKILAERFPLVFVAFDILFKDGEDLRGKPIEERLEILKSVVWENQDRVRVAETFTGEKTVKEVFEGEDEGLVAKLKKSAYENTRSESWIKIKHLDRTILDILDVEQQKQNITLITELGRVSVSAEAQIKHFYDKLPKKVEVRHFPTLSKYGKMRFPTFSRWVEDE